MEKKADVAARLARNSAAIGAKKAPKLYMVPKTTKPTVKATSTITQARRESGTLAADGGCKTDTFIDIPSWWPKGPSLKPLEYEAHRSGNDALDSYVRLNINFVTEATKL